MLLYYGFLTSEPRIYLSLTFSIDLQSSFSSHWCDLFILKLKIIIMAANRSANIAYGECSSINLCVEWFRQ